MQLLVKSLVLLVYASTYIIIAFSHGREEKLKEGEKQTWREGERRDRGGILLYLSMRHYHNYPTHMAYLIFKDI